MFDSVVVSLFVGRRLVSYIDVFVVCDFVLRVFVRQRAATHSLIHSMLFQFFFFFL